MEDYNKVLDATEVAENANGVAAEKMTVYNESLAAAQNRLTASIQQFAQDSNLDQILALAYDGLSKVMDILNILLNKIPILSPMIKGLGAVLAAAFGSVVIANMLQASNIIGNLPSIAAMASSAVSALGTTLFTIGTLSVPLWGVVAAIAAIGAALKAGYDIWKSFQPEEQLKQSTQELEEANQNLEETNSKIKDIQDKITEINSKGSLTLTDQAEKQRLEEQLDTLKEIRKVQQEIAQAKAEEQAQDVRDVVKSEYGDEKTSVDFYVNKAIPARQQTGAKEPYGTYDVESASINQLVANIKTLENAMDDLNPKQKDYAERVKEINSLETESRNKLNEKRLELLDYKQTLIDAGDTSSEEYQTIVNRINEITVALDPSQLPKVDLGEMISTSGMEEKIKMVVKSGSEAGKEVATRYAEQFANQLTSPGNEVELQAWKEALNIPDSQELGVDQLTQEILALFYQMYGNISTESSTATESIYSQKSALELYQEAVQQVHDNTTDLTAAYQDMIDKGYISESVVKKLTAAHPELVKELKLEDGQYKINLQTLQDVYQAEVTNATASIKSQSAQTKATIENIKTRIQGYQQEAAILAQSSDDPSAKAKMIGLQHSIDRAEWELDAQYKRAQELEGYTAQLDKEVGTWTPPSKKSTSSADKTAKEFENSVKEKMKNLKGVVTTYSTDGFGAWDSQEAIDKATSKYNEFLKEIVDNPEARKIAAEQLGISIEGESTEDQIRIVTNALKEQEGTIEEAHQKLIKEDLEAKDKELAALEEIEKEEKEQYDNALKYIEEIEKTAVSMIETGIDLLDKLGSLIFDKLGEVSDQYDAQLDNLDKISDNLDDQSDALDDQKDAFDDKIDAQKELLKLQKEEMDNADELADKNKAIADIDAQLIELQYDDSAEAQAKRLKLLDERAEKEKDLADYQKEYDYDTKVSALDKEKSAYDKSIETQKKLLELQKKVLEEQKKTIEDAQKSYEKTLQGIEDGFNTFIEILSSDVVKNLLSKALISFGGDTAKNLMLGWNKIFGTGDDADIIKQWEDLQKTGWQPGQWLGNLTNWFKGASNTKQSNIDAISQGRSQLSIEKNQLEAGNIDLSKTFTSSVDIKSIKDQLNKVTQVFDNAKSNVSTIMDKLGNGIKTTFGNVGQNIMNFANSIGGNIQVGVQSASDIFTGLGNTLKDVFNLDWTGITGAMGDGLGIVSNTLSKMFTPVANGAASIGDAIGSGITGFFPGIFSAMAQLVSTVGTAMGGVLTTIGDTMASIPVVGWAIAAAAIAGAVALVATIAGIVSQTKNAKVSQPKQSFTAKKHHNGADYVKKENSALDDMLGLGEDETVSILKVGEAVVPTWANNATSSSNSSSYTGSPFGNAVDSAVKSARANSQTSYRTGDSSVNISMPINIQGDADATTVRALKKEADNIVNKVLKTINNQTRIGGYRNIKAATV